MEHLASPLAAREDLLADLEALRVAVGEALGKLESLHQDATVTLNKIISSVQDDDIVVSQYGLKRIKFYTFHTTGPNKASNKRDICNRFADALNACLVETPIVNASAFMHEFAQKRGLPVPVFTHVHDPARQVYDTSGKFAVYARDATSIDPYLCDGEEVESEFLDQTTANALNGGNTASN